jgi:hypothetical protein
MNFSSLGFIFWISSVNLLLDTLTCQNIDKKNWCIFNIIYAFLT